MRVLVVLSLLTACKKAVPIGRFDTIDRPTTAVRLGPLDQREAVAFTLPNGLKAVVVHDPDATRSAAAMYVHRGYYDDPADRPGLTHFLEHMLLLGSDEFPEVDAYASFVEGHGGEFNASTENELTSYHFELEPGHLEGALDRFSRYFVAPAFDPLYVDRERRAVQSEFTLRSEHVYRIQEVRKKTMNQKHPESKFVVGTLETLADRGEDRVYDRLLELYETTFTAEDMTFAMVGREPVSTLKDWTIREFSEVPTRPTTRPERPEAFLEEHVGVRIDVEAIDERRLLELHFPVRPSVALWPHTPHGFVGDLLEHEGEGTLFAVLKDNGWITSLSVNNYGSDDVELFYVLYELTEEGARNLDVVVASTFEAIARIEAEGVTEARHAERTVRRQLHYAFAEEPAALRTADRAARTLAWAPPEHALNPWAVPAPFDGDLIRRETLSNMTIDQARMVVTLPAVESGAALDQVEERYGVTYGMRAFTSSERETFARASGLAFALPKANPYLPERTTLFPGGESGGLPVQLEAGAVDLWHSHDTTFGVPRAYTNVRLYSDTVRDQGARGAVLARLYNALLDDALQPAAHPLREAGLFHGVGADALGLDLTIYGYDDRQGAVLRDLVTEIRDLRIDPDRLALEKAELRRYWLNLRSERAYEQAVWALQESLDPDDYDVAELLPVVDTVTVAEVEAFSRSLVDRVQARMLVSGNVPVEGARTLAGTVESVLLSESEALASFDVVQRTIPNGVEVVRNVAIDAPDSTLVVRYQDSETDRATQARWSLLGALVGTPFYTQLRTEQQLGYAVQAEYDRVDRLPGVTLLIQSPVAGPVTLLARVDAFLAGQVAVLEAMPDEAFDAARSALAASYRADGRRLLEHAQQLEHELVLQEGFRQGEGLADAVDALTKDEMIVMWNQVFLGTSGRLVVRSFGTAHGEERDGRGCDDEACVSEKLGEYRRALW